jgi:ribosomal protein L12E/L44/L45/RPP1/RPP2
MRSGKSFLILLLLAAGIGSYAYFVESKRDTTADSTTKHPKLLTADAGKITEIDVHAASGDDTTLKKSGDTWQITSPIQASADSAQVNSLVSSLTSLESQRTIDEHPASVASFGLSPARFSVAFKQTGDNAFHRVDFGSKTPAGSDTYVQVEGQPAVVLVSSYIEDTLNRGTFDLRDKTALKFAREAVDSITVEPASGAKVAAVKKGSDWRLTAPADARADYSAVDTIVGRLEEAKIKSIVAPGSRPPAPTKPAATTKPGEAAKPASTPPGDATKPADASATPKPETKPATGADTNYSPADLKAYGLDKPELVATVGAGSTRASLAIGGKYDDTSVYARDLSRPLIFTLDKAILDDVKKKPDDLRVKDVFEFRTFTANAIDLTYGGVTYSFTKVKAPAPAKPDQSPAPVDTWKETTPTAKDVDQTKFTDLLTTLSNLRSDSFADKALVSGDDLTADVKFGDPTSAKEERVTLRKSGTTAQAVHPGDTGAAVVPVADLDKVVSGLKGIVGIK